MVEARTNNLHVPKFKGEKNEYWAINLKVHLVGKGLWNL